MKWQKEEILEHQKEQIKEKVKIMCKYNRLSFYLGIF